MNISLLLVAALVTGALVPLQLAFNAQLGQTVGSPFVAAFLIFLIGGVAVAAILAFARPALPDWGAIKAVPGTAWLGGVIATIYILSIVFLVPTLGVGLTTTLILVGQLMTAMVLDHLGVFGNPQQTLNIWRGVGAMLMIAGVVLIKTH